MFDFFLSKQARRNRLLECAPEGSLKHYLSIPLPDLKTDILSTPLLALDFETSGLDASTDRMLSVGWVEINNGDIDLASASHLLIDSKEPLSEKSVIIHKITDDVAAAGECIEIVIEKLLQALSGRLMLAHNANIEIEFLSSVCQKIYGLKPTFPVIDTMIIARRWFERRNKEIRSGDLRLFNLRKRYGLPMYQAHNALSDAISTAELLQAQVAHMDSKGPLRVSQFLV